MTDFQVRRYESPESFLKAAYDWLMQDEVANNEIISAADLVIRGNHHYQSPLYWATIHFEDQVCGCAIQAPPDAFTVSSIPHAAIDSLLSDRLAVPPEIKWITAMGVDAEEFGRLYELKTRAQWAIKYRWVVHAAAKTIFDSSSVPGLLRIGSTEDSETIMAWAATYADEFSTPIDIPDFFDRKLKELNLYLWDWEGAKCAIAVSGQTASVARISAVYVPAEHRGFGFARAGVSAVTDRLLNGGLKYCLLVTDESKPSLAEMYSSIGYQAVSQRLSIELGHPS